MRLLRSAMYMPLTDLHAYDGSLTACLEADSLGNSPNDYVCAISAGMLQYRCIHNISPVIALLSQLLLHQGFVERPSVCIAFHHSAIKAEYHLQC